MSRRFFSTLAAWLAPLALFLPWYAEPAMNGGFAFGGWAFFFRWLVKYPNLGPINWEVGLGIVCVIGSALVALAFAAYATFAREPRRRVQLALFVALLVLYAPVFARLDLMLWFALIAGRHADGLGALLRLAALANVAIVVRRASRPIDRSLTRP